MANRVIWKFPLSLSAISGFNLPASASVKMTGLDPASKRLAIWVELDSDAPREDRQFMIRGTGHRIEGDDWFHVGSAIDGNFVWHVYEKRQ